ncbi:MAG: tetratricopeptide repeat protein [Planctomycetota bacterium]
MFRSARNAPRPRSPRWCFLALLVLLPGLGLGGGCESTASKPRVSENIRLVSENGSALYFQAKDTYAGVRQRDLQGDTFTTEMDKVLRLLDAAVVNDPGNPLFRSKRADVWLELGQFDLAQKGYDNARLITEDWVPSWVGTADIALINGDYELTDAMLTSAWSAVRGAEDSLPKFEDPFAQLFAIVGLNIFIQPSVQHPDDPTLSAVDRQRLLTHWLQESESWTIENPDLKTAVPGGVGQVGGGRNQTVNTAGLFRRLRAGILYRRARLTQANPPPPVTEPAEDATATSKSKKKKAKEPPPPPPTPQDWLDQALTWDPNYFPAKLMRAELYVEAGRVRDAERILRPYLNSSDPKLAHNGRLLLAMANIYAVWFDQAPSPELADDADTFFVKLHELNPRHTQGYLDRARFYLATGTHFERPDTLRAGLACLNTAEGLLGGPNAETANLRQLLQDALGS